MEVKDMIGSINLSGMDAPAITNDKRVGQQYKKTTVTVEQEAYIVDIGNNTDKVTYSKPQTVKPDMKRVEQLKKEADNALAPLRQMVENLLKEQGMTFKDVSLKANEGKLVQIDDATRAEAQRLISEDGEYGIEQTSNRLLEFAKAISGDDKTKYNQLKAAIEEGFSQAQEAWGGELPDICKKTIDSTLEKLDKWANSKESKE